MYRLNICGSITRDWKSLNQARGVSFFDAHSQCIQIFSHGICLIRSIGYALLKNVWAYISDEFLFLSLIPTICHK